MHRKADREERIEAEKIVDPSVSFEDFDDAFNLRFVCGHIRLVIGAQLLINPAFGMLRA